MPSAIGRVGVVPAGLELDERQPVGVVAVDLVGRHGDEHRLGRVRPAGLEQVERADGVHVEVVERAGGGEVVARLGGGVDHELVARPLRSAPSTAVAVADVEVVVGVARAAWPRAAAGSTSCRRSGPKKSARMLLSTPSTAKPEAVEELDRLRADEPGGARDEDLHAGRRAAPVEGREHGPRAYWRPCETPDRHARRRDARAVLAPGARWHRRATLDTAAAVAARGDVEQVGVAARHREPAPEPGGRRCRSATCRCPGSLLYEAWQRLRWPPVERATGPVDVVHATAHVARRRPGRRWSSTVHDLHFLHEPDHFTRRGVSVFTPVPRPRPGAEATLVVVPVGGDARRLRGRRHRARPAAGGPVGRPTGAGRRRGDRERCGPRYALDRPFVLFVGHDRAPQEPAPAASRPSAGSADVDARPGARRARGLERGPRRRSPASAASGSCPGTTATRCTPAAAVVCLPEPARGLRAPVLEAMAQGAAVVTSATHATAEVAGDAARAGRPARRRRHRRRPSQRLLDDPDLRRSARRGRAASGPPRFTWDAHRRAALVAAYREAAGRQPVSRRPGRGQPAVAGARAVGGSEESTRRQPPRPARPRPRRPRPAPVRAVEPFAAAHPDLAEALPTEVPALAGSLPRACGSRPSPPGSPARTRALDLVHHAGAPSRPCASAPCVLTIHDLQPLERPGHPRAGQAGLPRRR